jgi:hypothetical protein
MSDTVFTAANKIRERASDVEGKVEKADPTPPKAKKATKKPGGTTADQARRSRHTGASGEPSYGAPIDRQTTDSNNGG